MSFETSLFWAFLAVVWAVWLVIPNNTAKKILLIAASYYLYSTFAPRGHWAYVFLLAGFTLVSYWMGNRAGDAGRDLARRRAWMIGGVVVLVAALAIAKGAAAEGWILALPVGISFYALQAISYVADAYRGDLVRPSEDRQGSAQKRPQICDYGLYMSFFPRLAAGPIVRAGQFLPQLAEFPRVSSAAIWESLVLICFGLFKKMVIADNIAAAVDPVFADLHHATVARLLLAGYGYAIQIYCDFAGYTDMALGIARLFGYRLPENFNWPYLAANPADFWRRWHISLSNWLRDYVYFSLPGLRSKSKLPAYFNLIVTMAICGIWHGVQWTFLVWGVYHGVLLAGYNAIRSRKLGMAKLPSILIMQQLAVIGWIFFRADRPRDVATYFQGLLTRTGFSGFDQTEWTTFVLTGFTFLLHLVALKLDLYGAVLKRKWNPWALLLLLILGFATAVLSVPKPQVFLYFRF